MAIDTKSLTEFITEFRAIQAKDAVSPDNLGRDLADTVSNALTRNISRRFVT